MKIILSRKGFDSQFGGFPSPILPNKSLISLPIPQRPNKSSNNIYYKDLIFDENRSYLDIMQQLGMNFNESSACHLDPDIREETIERRKGWRPLFGQLGSSQSHLQKLNVREGDLFLFFGWFRKTKTKMKKLQFDSNDSGKHIIFGYLQIGEQIPLHYFTQLEEWMTYHPHADYSMKSKKFNTIYIAKKKLTLNPKLSGASALKYNDNLTLSKKGYTKSKWDLPEFFKDVNISYHDKNSWKEGYFQSVSRGQEFVIEADNQVIKWAMNLIETSL